MTQDRALTTVYALALINVGVLGLWGVAFDVPGMVAPFLGRSAPPVFGFVADGMLLSGLGLAAAVLVYLMRRPWGWGKLALVAAGVSWTMHGLVLILLTNLNIGIHVAGPWVPIACGVVMIAQAAWHQVVDPSFFKRPAPSS